MSINIVFITLVAVNCVLVKAVNCILVNHSGTVCENPDDLKYANDVFFDCQVMPYGNTTTVTEENSLECKNVSSEVCSKWSFDDGLSSTDLVTVKLSAFGDQPDIHDRSALNVTLKQIKFTRMRYRIQKINDHSIVFCREIRLPPDIKVSDISFHCFWKGFMNNEREPFKMEYEATNGVQKEIRTYLFRIYSRFKREDKNRWIPFLYVDVTENPVLTARLQQAPEKFGIQNYQLEVYDDNEFVCKSDRSGTNNSDEELIYPYTIGMFPKYGKYIFKAQVIGNSCAPLCIAVSPTIYIGDSARKILISCIIAFILITLLLLLILYIWRRRTKPYFDINKLPKVLILYRPSSQPHIKSVIALTEYLRDSCFIVALLDQLDVARTKTKNPYIWYNEAFHQADCIMVIASPPECCTQGIFKKVDVLALNFLVELLSHHKRPHIFNVLFDYCTKDHIPEVTVNFRTYRLTADVNKMLWYIHNDGRFPRFADLFFTFLGPKLYGGKSDLNTFKGRALMEALTDYKITVCNCKKENSSYNVSDTLHHLSEMMIDEEEEEEEEELEFSKSNEAVTHELDKFFIDLETLNLSGESESPVHVTSKEPNFLDYLNL